jgi:hypothetical protein
MRVLTPQTETLSSRGDAIESGVVAGSVTIGQAGGAGPPGKREGA